MFSLSSRSQNNLSTCHPNLIALFEAAIKTTPIDYSVICGHRGEKDQNEAHENVYSDLTYPHSKHNQIPSLGTDIQPYPYTEEDRKDKTHAKFRELNEHIKKVAKDLGIPVINGGLDWGRDWYHWELVL